VEGREEFRWVGKGRCRIKGEDRWVNIRRKGGVDNAEGSKLQAKEKLQRSTEALE